MSDNMVISTSGICRTFDAAADGYGRGEAVNAIFIKPLETALKDGDPTAFFECHGTGTIVGDTAETSVVAKIFGEDGIHIGAVKANVGHSEGASGITSVIKCVLALENRTIPPNVYFENPNPNISFQGAKLKVPVKATAWPGDRFERISVNSFGIGGTNAHLILDSASSMCRKVSSSGPHTSKGPTLLLLSGKTSKSLDGNIKSTTKYLEDSVAAWSDVAYTLAHRREHMDHRAFAIVEEGKAIPSFEKGHRGSLQTCFVFTGQGAQWPGMGKELISQSKKFRETIRSLDRVLQRLEDTPKWSMEDELLSPSDGDKFKEAMYAQPLCTAIQIGLVNLLRDWNIEPSVVVGHSSGEIAAAYASGAIPAEVAITVAYLRGHSMKYAKTNGAMAAIGLAPEQMKPYLKDGVVIACENSPQNVTVSGDRQVLEEILLDVQVEGDILCRRLPVNVAYHSHHMKELGEIFENSILHYMSQNQSMVPLFSTTTGDVISDCSRFDATYWRQNLESPVLFSAAIRKILNYEKQPKVFVEIVKREAETIIYPYFRKE
ncbi:hypothetical protein EYZ11_005484 [Aspergillus tanneri]|uniref:Ketosynthase family 3 (KS3) domain-containing protein n=1 Tax=Aspergillus tanneri TaxID=1220188 RepID=A0A4S3JHV4_9EURO|nr:hypothetical protein EYZ11_005484 [Aspergillus tanneri]